MATVSRVYATAEQYEQVARVLKSRGHQGSTKEYFAKINYQIKGVNYKYWEVDRLLGVSAPATTQPSAMETEFQLRYFELVKSLQSCTNITQVRKVLAKLS